MSYWLYILVYRLILDVLILVVFYILVYWLILDLLILVVFYILGIGNIGCFDIGCILHIGVLVNKGIMEWVLLH